MAPQQSWTIAHLHSEEPDAAPYLHDDFDDATLASTPSMRFDMRTTILRHSGEPCGIIIAVDSAESKSKRALKKLWKLIRLIFLSWRHEKENRSGASQTSTLQPSLGVNGVMVWRVPLARGSLPYLFQWCIQHVIHVLVLWWLASADFCSGCFCKSFIAAGFPSGVFVW